jgi:hypothetical protein
MFKNSTSPDRWWVDDSDDGCCYYHAMEQTRKGMFLAWCNDHRVTPRLDDTHTNKRLGTPTVMRMSGSVIPSSHEHSRRHTAYRVTGTLMQVFSGFELAGQSMHDTIVCQRHSLQSMPEFMTEMAKG